MRRTTVALILAAALAATACLQKDTTSTIYLHPDGSFEWVVLEQNVRSDEGDSAARLSEEAAYVASVDRGDLGTVNGLLALGGHDVRVRWLRGARPYAVMVDARFDDLASVFDRVLTRCETPHTSAITKANGITTWALRADVGPDGAAPGAGDACDDGLGGLSEALDFTVVLESGAFTAASGFTIRGSDTAVIDEKAIEDGITTTGTVELSLSWR
jgi:hypothetical protein